MKENIGQRINEFIKKILDVPPTLEELEANFPHKPSCEMSVPLSKSQQEVVISSPSETWAGSSVMVVTQKYLECDDCHTKVMYIE